MERQQDAEIRKEKERKAQNALLAKEALIANQTLESLKMAAEDLAEMQNQAEESMEIEPTEAAARSNGASATIEELEEADEELRVDEDDEEVDVETDLDV